MPNDRADVRSAWAFCLLTLLLCALVVATRPDPTGPAANEREQMEKRAQERFERSDQRARAREHFDRYRAVYQDGMRREIERLQRRLGR